MTPSARSRTRGDGPTGGAATEEGGARLRRLAASPSPRRWDAKLRAMTARLLLLQPPEKESVAIGREDATMESRSNDAGDLLEVRAVGGAAFLVVILR